MDRVAPGALPPCESHRPGRASAGGAKRMDQQGAGTGGGVDEVARSSVAGKEHVPGTVAAEGPSLVSARDAILTKVHAARPTSTVPQTTAPPPAPLVRHPIEESIQRF